MAPQSADLDAQKSQNDVQGAQNGTQDADFDAQMGKNGAQGARNATQSGAIGDDW